MDHCRRWAVAWVTLAAQLPFLPTPVARSKGYSFSRYRYLLGGQVDLLHGQLRSKDVYLVLMVTQFRSQTKIGVAPKSDVAYLPSRTQRHDEKFGMFGHCFLHGLPPRLWMGERRGSTDQHGTTVAGRNNGMAKVIRVLRLHLALFLASQQANPSNRTLVLKKRSVRSLVVVPLVLAPLARATRHL